MGGNLTTAMNLINKDQSDFLLEVFLNNTDSSVILTDRDFNIIFFNKLADQWSTDFVGLPLQKGMPLIDLASDDRKEAQYSLMKDALAGKQFEIEYPIEVPPDDFVCFSNTYMPAKNNKGEIIGILITSKDITERKKREEQLKASDERFHLIAKATSDAVWDYDVVKARIYFNESFTRYFGHDPAKWENGYDLWEKHIHTDDRERVITKINACINGKETYWEDEYRFVTNDGNTVYVYDRGLILRNDAGDAVRMIGSMQDITERKYKDHVLHKALNELNKIMASSVDVIVVTDAENRFVQVSAAAEAVWGYKPGELIGRNCIELLHPDDVALTNTVTANVMQGKKITHFQNRYIHKNGSVVPLIWSASWDENEKVMYAIARDASEKLEAETALRKSESMFRAISENFPNGVVAILDKDLRFVYIAGKEMQAMGLTASYFIGTLYSEHFPADELAIREGADKVFAGESMVSELRFMDRNYLVSSVPLHEEGGMVERMLVVAQNITQQKRSQKEKELLINELTKNVQDLRQFSYITSHNLRAPISNLIGIMSLINMEVIHDEDTRFLVEKFKESTYILNETVNDLLNILLIKNSVNVKKEMFRLSQVWQHVCTSVNNQVVNTGAKIDADFSNGDDVMFNKSYAESILLNLLTNSLKYRHHGRPLQITLRTFLEDEYMVLQFTDNGIGINLDHHRKKIFGLYQRFHNYPDSKGLGLYIVHSQVTALGGKIEVESEPDKGTSFKICFKR